MLITEILLGFSCTNVSFPLQLLSLFNSSDCNIQEVKQRGSLKHPVESKWLETEVRHTFLKNQRICSIYRFCHFPKGKENSCTAILLLDIFTLYLFIGIHIVLPNHEYQMSSAGEHNNFTIELSKYEGKILQFQLPHSCYTSRGTILKTTSKERLIESIVIIALFQYHKKQTQKNAATGTHQESRSSRWTQLHICLLVSGKNSIYYCTACFAFIFLISIKINYLLYISLYLIFRIIHNPCVYTYCSIVKHRLIIYRKLYLNIKTCDLFRIQTN